MGLIAQPTLQRLHHGADSARACFLQPTAPGPSSPWVRCSCGSGKVLQKLPTLATATKNREDDGKKCAAHLNGPVHFHVNLPSAQTPVLHLGVGAPGRRLSPNRQHLQAKGQRGRRGRRLSATCQGFLLERQRKGSASATRKVHQHRCIKAACIFWGEFNFFINFLKIRHSYCKQGQVACLLNAFCHRTTHTFSQQLFLSLSIRHLVSRPAAAIGNTRSHFPIN